MRYADDFVVLARFIGEPIEQFLEGLLEGKMGLRLNRQKTRIIDLRQKGASLDFLGYSFRFERNRFGKGQYLNLFPSKKALKRRRAEVKALTGRHSSLPIHDVVSGLNRAMLGWGRYFCMGYPSKAFSHIDDYTRMRLGRFARTRSQRPMKLPKGLSHYAWTQRLGLIRLADPQVIRYLRGQRDFPQAYRRAG